MFKIESKINNASWNGELSENEYGDWSIQWFDHSGIPVTAFNQIYTASTSDEVGVVESSIEEELVYGNLVQLLADEVEFENNFFKVLYDE